MGYPPLSEYLAERDAQDAESFLRSAGIERTADLLQLSAEDLASLGVPAELQYKLYGQYNHPVAVDAAQSAAPAAEPAFRPRRTTASAGLDEFLEMHGLGEALQLLLELGIERLSDLEHLNAPNISALGLPEHLQQGIVAALGLHHIAPPAAPASSSSSSSSNAGATTSVMGTVGAVVGDVVGKLGSRAVAADLRPRTTSGHPNPPAPTDTADIHFGAGKLLTAELGGPRSTELPPSTSAQARKAALARQGARPDRNSLSRPPLLMSESEADFNLHAMTKSKQTLLAAHSFIAE
jgi:hypothetical protein